MPRQLKEIKSFNLGTVLNLSERDISQDAASYSLNVDSLSENGILNGIENDKIFASTNDTLTTIDTPISWVVTTEILTGTNSNIAHGEDLDSLNDIVKLNSIELFNDKELSRIGFTGTQGHQEFVMADNVQPYYELLMAYGTTAISFIPASTVNLSDTIISYSSTGVAAYITDCIVVEDWTDGGGDGGFSFGITTAAGGYSSHGTTVIFLDDSETSTSSAGTVSTIDIAADGLADAALTDLIVAAINGDDSSGRVFYGDNILSGVGVKGVTAAEGSEDDKITLTMDHTGTRGNIVAMATLGGQNSIETRTTFANGTDNTHTAAIGYINIDAYGSISTGSVTLVDTFGTSTTFTAGTDFTAETSNATTATNLATAINDHSSFTATATQGGVKITQSIAGAAGNTTITDNASGLTVLSFVLGTGIDPTKVTDYFSTGDYLTLDTSTYTQTDEIMKILAINEDNNEFEVKRGCFGREPSIYTLNISNNVYSNRLTIDGVQNRVNHCEARFSSFSDYAGNHIGGNSHYLTYCASGAISILNGQINSAATLSSVVYSATDKTVTFGANIDSMFFEEGDIVTFYHNAESSNNSFSGKILKKASDGSGVVLTLDTAPTDETEATDIVYMEANILKNHTFFHKVDVGSISVGDSGSSPNNDQQVVNDWHRMGYRDPTGSAGIGNQYGWASYHTVANISVQNNSHLKSSHDLKYLQSTSAVDLASEFYPFDANGKNIKLIAGYSVLLTGNIQLATALVAEQTDNIIYANAVCGSKVAKNDILKLASSAEYMLVIKVEGRKLTVRRGHLGSTLTIHNADVVISKCQNEGIQQIISKDRLKSGQSYTLTFYAQDNDQVGYGGLSLRLNGGYFDTIGNWTSGVNDLTYGYLVNTSETMQEDRWIGFEDLTKPNNDAAVTSAGEEAPNGLDNIFRKFSYTFYLPKRTLLTTDLILDFAARGIDTKYIYISGPEIHENTLLYNADYNSLAKISGQIDNKGSKTLVSYDSKQNKLKVSEGIFKGINSIPNLSTEWAKSILAAETLSTSSGDVSMVSNNREMHIGFGGAKSDSPPQWLGYVNHTIFGQDYTNELYQDEDTVHKYDEGGTGSMTKLCVAGEHERIQGVISSSGSIGDTNTILTVTHTAHSMNLYDNIVVREWMDTDNSWTGAGVWFVSSVTSVDIFVCKRNVNKDKQASTVASNNLICYRPYFYYGIKDEEPAIYRIWPDDLITGTSTISTSFTKGTVEKSLPIPIPATSICTYYNKDTTTGTKGGRVYILSAVSDEVLVFDVQKKYNEWDTTEILKISSVALKFKSFKWSNDNINGNIGGATEVMGGLADESSPTISYAGLLSDIIETKGTHYTFEHDTVIGANDDIDLSMFDTRLWIQCRPTSEDGFTEGDRFLFCGKSEDGNTDGPDSLYCADRTPPTTMVCHEQFRNWEGGHKFRMGPGIRPSGPNSGTHSQFSSLPTYGDGSYEGIGKYSYFYHYLDDSHNTGKDKLERFSVCTSHASEHDGTAGAFQAQGTGHSTAYVNFGYNVGWDASDGMPSIKIAKYGLFQIADNDGDGLLDGTGVVCASDFSITDTTNLSGPYGKLHQRVTSHAVGIIGGADTAWVRHWGRYADQGHRIWITGKGDRSEDIAENMSTEKCIFIAADTHYGDYQPQQQYTFASAVDSGTETRVTLDAATPPHDTSIGEGLMAGDNIRINGGGGKAVTISSIDYTNRYVYFSLKYSDLASYSGDSGTFQSHCIEYQQLKVSTSYGGVLDSEKMFHFAFDEDEPDNGLRFTTGPACGHYTKTFMTPLSKIGADISGSQARKILPGFVFKIEKLSYRGGVMMRPFNMDDDAFNDLLIGKGVHIDMPCFPNPVYNTTHASNYLHHNVGGTVNNHFANKMFITSPIYGDSNQRSKIYLCDLDFMYPNESSQIEYEGSSYPTNAINEGVSWDIYTGGRLEQTDSATYINVDAEHYLEGDAANMPLVNLGYAADGLRGRNTDLFDSGSEYRRDNNLAGMMLTIRSSTTGIMQTRQIVGSKFGNKAALSGTDSMWAKVHYPFGFTPVNNDYWWLWKHSLAVTAPVRLYKTTTLPYGLGDTYRTSPNLSSTTNPIYLSEDTCTLTVPTGTTGIATCTAKHGLAPSDTFEIIDASSYNGIYAVTSAVSPLIFNFADCPAGLSSTAGKWRLIPDSEAAPSNPLTIPLTTPILSTHFGGLDMRKLKTYATRTGDPSIDGDSAVTGSDAEARIFFSANHLLDTGDSITLNANTLNFDGTYIIKESATASDVDVYNSTLGDDDNNSLPITTNQWEMLIAGTQGRSEAGELRAGITNWDKGNIAGNITRYDSTADEDRFISFAESSVIINAVSLGDQTGDFFLKNNRYFYKVSFIYDGYQEGPLSDSYWSHYDTVSRDKLSIQIKLNQFSRRLSHVCLYRKDDTNDFYKLIQEIPTKSGWNYEALEGIYSYILGDEGELGATYEARTGMSEVIDTLRLKYGISIEMDGYLIAGDCSHDKIKDASSQIFRSRPGMFSLFDYVNDFLVLKSKPTALANFNGRLYAFDSNNTYRINHENLAIEDTYEGVGCLGKDSVVVTEYGMFFADKNGAYMHNGQTPVKISESIQKGGETESGFNNTVVPEDISWNSLVTFSDESKPYAIYDSNSSSVLFNITKKAKKEQTTTISNISADGVDVLKETRVINRQYIWSYSITKKRWDLYEMSDDAEVGKPFLGEKGEVYFPLNGAIWEHRGGSSRRDYTWISKKITNGEDSIVKVFNKIKLNGLTKDINLGGDNVDSSDKLIILTSTGTIASSDITYTAPDTGHVDYKLSGSNKKGRWLQFKIENMREPLDSVGLIFRRKSTK